MLKDEKGQWRVISCAITGPLSLTPSVCGKAGDCIPGGRLVNRNRPGGMNMGERPRLAGPPTLQGEHPRQQRRCVGYNGLSPQPWLP
jgi:hypothetical protein